GGPEEGVPRARLPRRRADLARRLHRPLPEGGPGDNGARRDGRSPPRHGARLHARVAPGEATGEGRDRAAGPRPDGGDRVRAGVTALAVSPTRVGDFLELTKPRI